MMIIFWFILFAFIAETINASNTLCIIVSGVSLTNEIKPDFLNGLNIHNLSWVSTEACRSSTLSSFVSYDSGWFASNEITSFLNSSVISQQKQRKSFSATLLPTGILRSTITTSFSFIFTKSGTSVNVNGSVFLEINSIPITLISRSHFFATGSLKGTSTSLLISDSDLFDGFPAREISISNNNNNNYLNKTLLIEQMKRISMKAMSISGRFKYFNSVPSLEGDASIRLAFFQPSNLQMNTSFMIFDETGLIFQPIITCSGLAECGESMYHSFLELAKSGDRKGVVCSNASILDESLSGMISSDTKIDASKGITTISSVHAISRAVILCNEGSFSITLQVLSNISSSSTSWPTKILLENERSSIQAIKSIPLIPSGYRTAFILQGSSSSSSLITTVSGDIFSSLKGGMVVSDTKVDPSSSIPQFNSLVYKISSLIDTGIPALDNEVKRILTTNSNSLILQKYFSKDISPSFRGLLEFWAEAIGGGIELLSGDEDKSILIRISMTFSSISFPINISDPAFSSFNSQLHLLYSDVCSKFPTTCSYAIPSTSVMIPTSTYPILSASISALISIQNFGETMKLLSPIEKWAKASVSATFSSSSLLSNAKMTYWYEESSLASIDYAVVTSAFSIGVVSRGFSGITIYDNSLFSSETLRSISSNLGNVIESIEDRESTILEMFNGISFSSIIKTIQKFLSTSISCTSSCAPISSISNPLLSMLKHDFNEMGISSFEILPDSSTNKISFSITFFSWNYFSVSDVGSSWESLIPLSRLKFHVPLFSKLQFWVSSSSFSILEFTQTGANKLIGFTLPIRNKMRTGTTSIGNCNLNIDFPNKAILSMNLTGKLERGSSVSIDFYQNLTNPSSIEGSDQLLNSLVSFSFIENDHGDYANSIDPTSVMNSFTDLFFSPSEALRYRLSKVISPLSSPLSSLIDLEDIWEDVNSWSFSSSPYPTLALSKEIKFPSFSFSETLDITLNGKTNFLCNISLSNAINSSIFISLLSKSFGNCYSSHSLSLSSYLQPKFVATNDDFDPNLGNIILVPSFAGIIYSLSLTTTSSEALFPSHLWKSPQQIPDELSWGDFYKGIYWNLLSPSGVTYSLPELTSLSVSSLPTPLIHQSRADFYPLTVPSVMFPINLKYQRSFSSSITSPTFSTGDGSINISSSGNFDLEIVSDVEISALFGVALQCSLGSGNLNLTTSFTSNEGSRFNDALVPNSPNNSFILTVIIEKHQASERNSTPELIQFSQIIVLTPGILVSESLQTEIQSQLNSILGKMIIVEERANGTRYSGMRQIIVSFWPKADPLNSDLLYVPSSVSISNSYIPGFWSRTKPVSSKAITTCPLTSQFHIGISVNSKSNADLNITSGILGILSLLSANAKLTFSHNFDFSAISSIQYLNVLLSSLLLEDSFKTQFSGNAAASSQIILVNLTLDAENLGFTELSEQQIILSSNILSDISKISSLAGKYKAEVLGIGETALALRNILYSNSTSLCKALSLSTTTLSAFSDHKFAMTNLPFVDKSLGPIFHNSIAKGIATAKDLVCEGKAITLSNTLKIIRHSFDIDINVNASITAQKISIFIEVNPQEFQIDSGFLLNSSFLMSDSSLIPGVGTSRDFSLSSKVSLSLGIDLKFTLSNGIVISIDSDKTRLFASAFLNASARLGAAFGSAIIDISSVKVDLNGDLFGTISDSGRLLLSIDGNAKLKANAGYRSILSCDLDINIPSIAAFFLGQAKPIINDSCLIGDSFMIGLDNVLGNMSLASFLEQDPSLFWSQLESDLESELIDYLFDKILTKDIAFLGPNLQQAIRFIFEKLDSSRVSRRIGIQISQIVSEMIQSREFPSESSTVVRDVEQTILDKLTNIFNDEFKEILLEKIPSPSALSSNYKWKFRLGTTTYFPLPSLSFDFGKSSSSSSKTHGKAQLSLGCSPNLVLNWKMSFDLSFNKRRGVSIAFPLLSSVFSVNITLDSGSCSMSGNLLALGAELNAVATLDGTISVIPSASGESLEALIFSFGATLSGEAQLGLVGLIKNLTEQNPEESMPSVPHLKTGILASWAFESENEKTSTPHSFQFLEPQLCLGTLLAKSLKRIASEVDKVIAPLEHVFGANGILLTPISGLESVLGGNANILHIAELLCELNTENCNVKDLETVIDVVNSVSKDIEIIKSLESSLNDTEGCNDVILLFKSFGIDFSSPSSISARTIDNEEDQGTLLFSNSIPESKRIQLKKSITKWKTSGSFGFHLDILNNFTTNIIAILLGQNVQMMSVSFPSASFQFSREWEIPIWAVPAVDVIVYAGASIVLSPPPITLFSAALLDALYTRNPSFLFTGLSLSTQLDNGQPRWAISGWVEVAGGASVGFSVLLAKISGEAVIYVNMQAAVRPINRDGSSWVSFDQIALQYKTFGIWGAVDLELQLKAGIRVALKACINFVITKKCWILASETWEKELWNWRSIPDTIPSIITSNGIINGDLVGWNSNPLLLLPRGDENDVKLTMTSSFVSMKLAGSSISSPSISADLTAIEEGTTMLFDGNPCTSPFSILLSGNLKYGLSIPNCSSVDIQLEQDRYETSHYYFSTNYLGSVNHPSILFTGHFKSLSLIRSPQYAITYEISGLPNCSSVSIESHSRSNFILSGNPSNYYQRSFTILGSAKAFASQITCSSFVIHSNFFSCDDENVSVLLPIELTKLSIFASSTSLPSLFTLSSIPTGRSVFLASGITSSKFIIEDMNQMNGVAQLLGNSIYSNELFVSFKPTSNSSSDTTISNSAILTTNSGLNNSHFVLLSNIRSRSFFLHPSFSSSSSSSSANIQSSMTFLPIADLESVQVTVMGENNSKSCIKLLGCHQNSSFNIQLQGGGNNEIKIGNSGGLKETHCPIFIHGTSQQTNVLRIDSSGDTSKLSWTITETKITATSLSSLRSFTVHFDSINRVIVSLGYSSSVYVDNSSPNVEIALEFPYKVSKTSSVRIAQTSSSVILFGSVPHLFVGKSQEISPFRSINGTIIVTGKTKVLLSFPSSEVLSQQFQIYGNCLQVNDSSLISTPSQWMKEQILRSGMKYELSRCNILAGLSAELNIISGNSNDSLFAQHAAMQVEVLFGSGNNQIDWRNPSTNVSLVIGLGDGIEKLSLKTAGPNETFVGLNCFMSNQTFMNISIVESRENSFFINHTNDVIAISSSILSSISFSTLPSNSTISFPSLSPESYHYSSRSITLATGNGYCFSPCIDCSVENWESISLNGKSCSNINDNDCTFSSRSFASVPSGITLSCGIPDWNDENSKYEGGCPFVLNGKTEKIESSLGLRSFVIFLILISALFTSIGFSSFLTWNLWRMQKRQNQEIDEWLINNLFRDILTAQFSWPFIIITASIGNTVASSPSSFSLNGSAISLLLQVQHVCLEWFASCSDSLPVFTTVCLWIFSIISISLRIITFTNPNFWKFLSVAKKFILTCVQIISTSTTLLFIPSYTFYLSSISTKLTLSIISMIFIIFVILSQPLQDSQIRRTIGITSFVCVVILPSLLSFASGIGLNLTTILILSYLIFFAITIHSSYSIWTLSFSSFKVHNIQWYYLTIASFGFRLLSAFFGLAFLSLISSENFRNVSTTMWILWIVFGMISSLPLILLSSYERIEESQQEKQGTPQNQEVLDGQSEMNDILEEAETEQRNEEYDDEIPIPTTNTSVSQLNTPLISKPQKGIKLPGLPGDALTIRSHLKRISKKLW